MPHDKRGTELAVGDVVMVPCVVKAIHLTAGMWDTLAEALDRFEHAMTVNAPVTLEQLATEWRAVRALLDPIGLPPCYCGHAAGNHRWGSGSCWGATGKVPCDCVRYVAARVDPSPLAQLSENKDDQARVDGDTQASRRQDLPQSGNGR